MQYHIWAEMINGGLHTDLDNPPNISMFIRPGNPSVSAQARKNSSVSQVLTEAANVLTSSLLPKSSTSTRGNTGPSTDHSKLCKQLSELEKETIMGLLKKLEESVSAKKLY